MTREAAEYVRAMLIAGEHPDDIEGWVEDALEWLAADWAKWGDMHWRTDTVCPKCGSPYAGVCGHRETAGAPILRRFRQRKDSG